MRFSLMMAVLLMIMPSAFARPSLNDRLTAEMLLEEKFVVYCDLWEVAIAQGDPIIFHEDGSVENKSAGLAGQWDIDHEGILTVAGHRFQYNKECRCLFSPFTNGSQVGWRIVFQDDRKN